MSRDARIRDALLVDVLGLASCWVNANLSVIVCYLEIAFTEWIYEILVSVHINYCRIKFGIHTHTHVNGLDRKSITYNTNLHNAATNSNNYLKLWIKRRLMDY